jgi:hypothetical protein
MLSVLPKSDHIKWLPLHCSLLQLKPYEFICATKNEQKFLGSKKCNGNERMYRTRLQLAVIIYLVQLHLKCI